MFTTIRGYYEKGQIVLQEDAPVKTKTAVMITFLTENIEDKPKKKRIAGGLKGKVNIPDDFNQPFDDLAEYM